MSAPNIIRNRPAQSAGPFALVLGAGGARGFAHVGVLRALEACGLRPSGIVGVSMGAVVAATYALRPDWASVLEAMDTSAFPDPLRWAGPGRWQTVFARMHAAKDMFLGWGVGSHALKTGQALLRSLTAGKCLEEGRIPIAVCATDLQDGTRVTFRSGDAAEAVYASAALAGILPPVRRDGRLLSDGAYADVAPIDVARSLGAGVVVAVDPGQPIEIAEIRNGFQALLRAVDICQLTHAHLRFETADLVLRPQFRRAIDALEFSARRECIAAGMRSVRRRLRDIEGLVRSAGSSVRPTHGSDSEGKVS